ncbi:MAG TPA: GNAT family N-acetyltransferase [Acidimicrobiales bacterium]
MEISSYTKDHLDGVIDLSIAEGWTSFAESPERAHRALVAPGVTTVVAVSDGSVIGFAQLQSDGEIQAHLSLLVVSRGHRRHGIGRQLLQKAFEKGGATRIDLLTDSANEFYESLPHKTFHGYRLYLS